MSRPLPPREAATDDLTDEAWAHLCDQGPLPIQLKYFAPPDALRQLWDRYGAAVLAWWARERPGTRPSLWWKYQAPGVRQRIGGVGTPCFEVLAYVPRYEFGLPIDWIQPSDVGLFGRGFLGIAIDPQNPPLYESSATYLERHGLLMRGERARLTDRDFAPERVAGAQ